MIGSCTAQSLTPGSALYLVTTKFDCEHLKFQRASTMRSWHQNIICGLSAVQMYTLGSSCVAHSVERIEPGMLS
jgi:hypothetical protein